MGLCNMFPVSSLGLSAVTDFKNNDFFYCAQRDVYLSIYIAVSQGEVCNFLNL